MNKKLIKICKYELAFNYYVTDDGRIWSERTNKFYLHNWIKMVMKKFK